MAVFQRPWPVDQRRSVRPSASAGWLTRRVAPALVRLAQPEQSTPPRAPGSWWPGRPFPLPFGQHPARLPLSRDASGVGMPAALRVALGKQQRVRIHRQQHSVADRAHVGLGLPALGRAHVPPTHRIGHSARLRPSGRCAPEPRPSVPPAARCRRRDSADVPDVFGTPDLMIRSQIVSTGAAPRHVSPERTHGAVGPGSHTQER